MDLGTPDPDILTQNLLATSPAELLVIDDEPMVREVVSRYLEQDDHRVTTVADGPSARDALAHHSFDLIVLDLMLPGVDGLSILRELRRTDHAPVIVLTARGDETDPILGLELGADDYVVKPFSPRELAARVASVLRRSGSKTPTGVLQYGSIRIDQTTREVHVDGALVELTRREFDLLALLANAPRQVFTRAHSCSSRSGIRHRSGRTLRPSPSTSVTSARSSNQT